MKDDSTSSASRNRQSANRRLSISSHVLPGLLTALDSIVILSSGFISFAFIVNFGDPNYYAAAIAFVWLLTILLMNFSGLYRFEAITQPLIYVDKLVIVFITTFCFLFAAAFSLKISSEYSRIWTGTFALLSCLATILFRLLASYLITHLAGRQVFSRNVIVVGAGEQMQKLIA